MGHWSAGQKGHRDRMKSKRSERGLAENKKRLARLAEIEAEKARQA